jgi:hypothetical protein
VELAQSPAAQCGVTSRTNQTQAAVGSGFSGSGPGLGLGLGLGFGFWVFGIGFGGPPTTALGVTFVDPLKDKVTEPPTEHQ